MSWLAIVTLMYLLLVGLALRLLGGAVLGWLPINSRLARTRYLLAISAFLATIIIGFGLPFLPRGVDQGTNGFWTQSTEAVWEGLSQQPALEPVQAGIQAFWRGFAHSDLGKPLLAIWLAAAIVLVARRGLDRARLARRERHWHPIPPTTALDCGLPENVLAFTGRGGVPMALGVWRPRIYLPQTLLETLEPEQLARITAHEYAHIRWHDPAVDAALYWLCMLLWPVWPLWSLAALARRERESAADAAALADTCRSCFSVGDPHAYAKTLLAVATYQRDRSTQAVGATGDLECRVSRLLGGARRRPLVTAVFALAGTGLLMAALAAPPPGAEAARLWRPVSDAQSANWGPLDHYLGYNPTVQVSVGPRGRHVTIQGYKLDARETARWDRARTLAEKARIVHEAERKAAHRGTDPPPG